MTTTRGYPVEVQEEEDGSWTVLVPDLPGCVSAADTIGDAIELIGDAIDSWMAAATYEARPIPTPTPSSDEYSGRFVVRLPRSLHRAAAKRASREGVSLNTYCVAAITEVVSKGLVSNQASHRAPAASPTFYAVPQAALSNMVTVVRAFNHQAVSLTLPPETTSLTPTQEIQRLFANLPEVAV